MPKGLIHKTEQSTNIVSHTTRKTKKQRLSCGRQADRFETDLQESKYCHILDGFRAHKTPV